MSWDEYLVRGHLILIKSVLTLWAPIVFLGFFDEEKNNFFLKLFYLLKQDNDRAYLQVTGGRRQLKTFSFFKIFTTPSLQSKTTIDFIREWRHVYIFYLLILHRLRTSISTTITIENFKTFCFEFLRFGLTVLVIVSHRAGYPKRNGK